MMQSEKLAIAARLHVLLRRKTGRVTDTEWMAVNAEYATDVVRFARERAAEPGFEDVLEWAARLEQAVIMPSARRSAPVDFTATQPAALDGDFANSSWAESTIGMMRAVLAQHGLPVPPQAATSANVDANRYVGRLR